MAILGIYYLCSFFDIFLEFSGRVIMDRLVFGEIVATLHCQLGIPNWGEGHLPKMPLIQGLKSYCSNLSRWFVNGVG